MLGIKYPKPEKITKGKRRKARTEVAVVKAVRLACVIRDGHCRLFVGVLPLRLCGNRLWTDIHAQGLGPCAGPSQWAHLPPKTRAHTRGLPPEERHSTAWAIMCCEKHHDQIDGRRKPKLVITPTTPQGANGPIQVSVK